MNEELIYLLNQGDIAFDIEGATEEQVKEVIKVAFPDDTGFLNQEAR